MFYLDTKLWVNICHIFQFSSSADSDDNKYIDILKDKTTKDSYKEENNTCRQNTSYNCRIVLPLFDANLDRGYLGYRRR